MTRQQEVGDAFPYRILMPTVTTNQLSLHDLRLHQEFVQLLQHLLIRFQLFQRGRLIGQCGEAQLFLSSVSTRHELQELGHEIMI